MPTSSAFRGLRGRRDRQAHRPHRLHGGGKSTVGKEVARQRAARSSTLTRRSRSGTGRSPRSLTSAASPSSARSRRASCAVCSASTSPPSSRSGRRRPLRRRETRPCARAPTVWIAVEEPVAWERVQGGDRPLARDRESFQRLFEQRQESYESASDAISRTVTESFCDRCTWRSRQGDCRGRSRSGRVRLPWSPTRAWLACTSCSSRGRLRPPLPEGEAAKQQAVLTDLWNSFAIGRDGAVVAFGGGTTTDVAGFAAAVYARGVPWIALPTTLVGQVDAAIGGKTALDIDRGKNLVGAFHYPNGVIVDHELATLPSRSGETGWPRSKTGPRRRALWELPEPELVRACAAFKCGVCLADPYEQSADARFSIWATRSRTRSRRAPAPGRARGGGGARPPRCHAALRSAHRHRGGGPAPRAGRGRPGRRGRRSSRTRKARACSSCSRPRAPGRRERAGRGGAPGIGGAHPEADSPRCRWRC